jgi:D-alanyl-D-alanine carboxypeptidase/D-alanyl-D-alanine-endopeptidase (penicillin-binding protein 4)
MKLFINILSIPLRLQDLLHQTAGLACSQYYMHSCAVRHLFSCQLLKSLWYILLLSSCSANKQDKLYDQKPAFYSYVIGNVNDNSIYKENSADVYATPAGCQKILTTILALKHLGANSQYITGLSVNKKNNSVQDIVISFSGDPTLTSEDLLALLQPIKGLKVKGNIILDASVFKTPPHSGNIVFKDIGTSYGQPVFGINIDKNHIHLKVTSTAVGEFANIENDSAYKLISSVKTTDEDSSVCFKWHKDVIEAKGNINPKDAELKFKLSPPEIEPYILYKVQNVLSQLGIQGKIKIVYNAYDVPNDLTLLSIMKSKTLGEILLEASKGIDNLTFDSIYLTLINSYAPEVIKNWNQGDKVIKELTKKYLDIDMGNSVLTDGSGRSRYNRIQPRKLYQVLRKGFEIPEFVATLQRPGEEDSILEERTNLPSNVLARSGHLSGVSCLCGYKLDPKTPKAFVVMANSYSLPDEELFDLIDRFIKASIGP